MLIGDRKAMENVGNGKVHFRDQAEFRAWVEARGKENTTDAFPIDKAADGG